MLAKKRIFMEIFTLLSVSLAIAAPPAVHPTTGEPLVIDCLRGTPDAIDGDLSDWNLEAMTPAVLDVEGQLFLGQASWANAADCSGEFYLLWDNENIYIAVMVKDDKLSMNKTGGDIWNADCIEIFFSTTNAVGDCSEHYQYGFNANNQKWNWCNMDGNGSREPDYLQIASSRTTDGYICEASIEYGQMLSLNFTAGSAIGFHAVIDDTDNGDREIQMTWTSREAHDQSQGFGHLLLISPQSSGPTPADGEVYTKRWVNLGWSPGNFAASHDVYFGDNFADVDAGTSDTFIHNLPLGQTYQTVGIKDCPYPDGLVAGTTYYWRIDEVNDLHPNSPWKGDVWSFSIPSNKAREPIPADRGKFIEPDATLSWTPGYKAVFHHVYFGDNPDDVAAGTGGTDKQMGPLTSYSPGTLERDKTYYWRVDELDEDQVTHTGDVWSFHVAKEGGGIRGDYYHWSDPGFVGGAGNPGPEQAWTTFVLTRTDPRIDFTWATSPDPAIDVNNFSVRWTGEVEAAFTETYTFYARSDDGTRLWVNDQLIVEQWIDQSPTERSGTIDLVAGQRYPIVLEFYENGGGQVAELRWESEHTPKDFVPQAALSPPVRASSASPRNGATDVSQVAVLSWNPGTEAASHEVYFGTDPDALPRVTTKSLGDESYDPGKLAWDTTYYWRVNEINNLHPDSPWTGSIWSFMTADYLVVDNFEQYRGDEVSVLEQIWGVWRDGLGFGAPTAPPYSSGNGTGSEIGDPDASSYTEESITHGGFQSMPYWFNNNKPDKSKYSEAKRTLTGSLRDWTTEDVKALSIWFRGYPSGGSFEIAGNTYKVTGSGADIWNNGPGEGQYHDEFHFAYKQLTGAGTIIVKVESVQNTDVWAKAGVMIRETLDADSPHAFACITPASGVASQGRPDNGAASFNTNQTGITAPHWVRLQRDAGGTFTVQHSTDGSSWGPVTNATPQTVQMNTNVYIGLAVTSHNAALTCEAVFSGVQISGNVSGQWMHQDIGIESNDAERMYVAIANNTGAPAVVYHEDDNATQIDTWTEWNIDLKEFRDKGINLADVNSIAIGFGDRNNPQAGGAGKMYFDDIALYRTRCIPDKVTLSAADLNSDCIVDFADLELMVSDWLAGNAGLAGDLNADNMVDLKDYAALAEAWLEERLWPEW